MKKRYLVAPFLFLLFLPAVSQAQAYFSISELNEHPPARWTQTYETKWRTIEIDVQPNVPQTNKTPVAKVMVDYWLPEVAALGKGWESGQNNDGGFSVAFGNLNKNENHTTTTKNISPPYDKSILYTDNNDMTLADSILRLSEVIQLLGDDPTCWQLDCPRNFQVNTTIDKTAGKYLFPDILTFAIRQKICEIPLMGHMLNGIQSPSDQEVRIDTGELIFRICTRDVFHLFGSKVKFVELLSEDIPLCSFDIIKNSIEKEIHDGHIRRIFDLDFGYVLYNEPNSSYDSNFPRSTVFYAIPVWRVNCFFVESGKKEMNDHSDKDIPARGEMEYKTILINSQTGDIIDRSANRRGCGDYQGFLSWEDVGGRP